MASSAQRRVEERREDDQARREDEHRHELLDQQVRPDVDAVTLLALHALDPLGRDQGEEAVLLGRAPLRLGDVPGGKRRGADRRRRDGCDRDGAAGAAAAARSRRRCRLCQRRRGAVAGAPAGAAAGGRVPPRGARALWARTAADRARPSATRLVGALGELGLERRVEDRLVERCVFSPSLSRSLQGSRDAAVLADPPEVDREEDHEHERQGQARGARTSAARCWARPRRRPAAGSSPAWR